ncbi:tannase/feruloyl esterase family alpha/beta hydrolase [Acidobacteria bacterium AB60]|nr:tannase/feruloyl esterase family alpha/beta hydrolase [Acidobacteria bacterium AB60]
MMLFFGLMTGSEMLSAADCAAIKDLKLEGTTITVATEVSGSLELPGMAPLEGLPGFCRVAGVLSPNADSRIHFEVWLPEKDWNGRLLGTGNGGFAGQIYYPQLAAYLKRGFAVAGSDAGHQAENTDATWAYEHPEKVKDFGWRAVHQMTEHAKQVIQAYYGKLQSKSYFDACSDGGREALMEAQRFPEDYDGILAGAPANAWSTMLAAGIRAMQKLGDPQSYIPDGKLPFIQAKALEACDTLDGVKDGIVSNPAACKFDPSVLLCKGEDELSCLTRPQLQTLQILYGGFKDGAGNSIWPGYAVGDETGWRQWVVGEDPESSLGARFVRNYFRYMVADPKWNAQTADAQAMLNLSRTRMAADLDATDPDLGRFAGRGGKLILYHGWDDAAISPWNSVSYYQQVQKTMSVEKAAGFVRLYMAPGMEHCSGGPGPSAMGQFGMATAKGPQFGLFDSLQQWVEKGTPIEDIFVTKYGSGPDGKIKPLITRPLCAYPKVARYNGSGDASDAANFTCAQP